jgi:hypothetical protein
MSLSVASEYREVETPSVDLNCAAVIIVGISNLSILLRGKSGATSPS